MLSTLLVVGVISHLWCAARLVGIAHHSFYSVDKCIGIEGYESTQQAKESLKNNFTQTVSIPSSVTDQCIQEHAGSEASLQIERSRGRNSSGEYIPESSTNSECDVSEVFN